MKLIVMLKIDNSNHQLKYSNVNGENRNKTEKIIENFSN